MSEYVYFLKDANEDLMKVGISENPLAEAKSLSRQIDLEESRVIAFPDKEMAHAVIEELHHFLKSFAQGEGTGWYTTEAKDDLLEQAKQLGLKVDPILG
ncbi:GIY-YIG nuclease family protein [Acetobacteraceae bacterium]|nr:GIY-YIG nuclease family protein [Acetobacteraceae bacterium]